MPNPVHTLMDVQKLSPVAFDQRVVDDCLAVAPVFSKIPARAIAGTTYKYMRRLSVPKSGFRPANKGVGIHKSDYSQEVGQCFNLSAVIAIDEAVISSDPRGENALMAEECSNHIEGALFALEQQLFYGTKIDPVGFEGFDQAIGDYMTLSCDASQNTADTVLPENGASVWFVVADPKRLEVVWGNKKGLSFSPRGHQLVTDEEGKTFPAAYQTMEAKVGMTVRSEFGLARLRNESANHPLTDGWLAKGRDLFPSGVTPSFIVMTRATRARLQQYRSTSLTYNKKQSGQTAWAETPTEFEGIPIIVTDALLDDETPENIAAAAEAALTAKKNRNIPRR